MSQSRVYLRVDRVAPEVCAAAQDVTVSDVHEALGSVMSHQATMSERMRPVNRGLRVAGPAVTAFCSAGDNLMMHRALSLAQKGDVLVVQASRGGAQWGDVATQYAKHIGLAGVVVDGYVRDIDFLARLAFPAWATRIGPSSPGKSAPGMVNAPIFCDGVRVEPGDLVIGDGDGVVVVPKGKAAEVIALAQARMKREDEAGDRIRAGAALWELSGAAGSYAKLHMEEIDDAWKSD